jgi:hypothetical protein
MNLLLFIIIIIILLFNKKSKIENYNNLPIKNNVSKLFKNIYFNEKKKIDINNLIFHK